MTSLDRLYQVIREPVLTEKGTDDTADRNAYHFRVPVDANKIEVRQAVERLFKVKVVRVNTLRVSGKKAGSSPASSRACRSTRKARSR